MRQPGTVNTNDERTKALLGHSFDEATTQSKGSQKKHPSPITLRLSEEERARLIKLCAGTSMSAYIRLCVFGADMTRRKRRRRARPVADDRALARVLGLLGHSRLANNLNQLAYHANTGSLIVDEETRQRINEAYAHIAVLRAELMKALGLKALGRGEQGAGQEFGSDP